MLELYTKAINLEDTEWRDGYLAAIQDFERKPLAVRPQPEEPQAEQGEEMAKLIALIDKAHDKVVALCHGERWTMHVPAQPDSDPDLVIGEALRSAKKALIAARPQPESAKDVRELAADIRELQSQYEIGGSWCKLSLDEAAALIQSSFEAWERERQKTGLSDDAECRIVIRQINALTGIEDKVTFLQSFLASRQSASEPSEEARELAIACLEWDKPITFPSEQRQVERAAAEIERYVESRLAAERGRAERAEAVSEEEYSRGFNNGARASHSALVAIIEDKEKDIEVAEAEAKALREALTPSEITKAAYIGEFEFPVKAYDEDGEELTFPATVPWTTIKEIMAAILARAALAPSDPSPPEDGDGGEYKA
jgi:hypothetical protein